MLIHLASSHLCTCFMHQDNSNSHHVVITFVFNWIPKDHELLTNYVINFKFQIFMHKYPISFIHGTQYA
jgi:hypothetical protein